MNLFKADLIVVWPVNCDYPLWREMIRAHRHKFNKVIVGFMQTNDGTDYRKFVREAMRQDAVDFVEPHAFNGGLDWRDVITNDCLKLSISDWIYFTEQDFFFKDKFWDTVDSMVNTPGVEYIGVLDGVRLHPCSLLIKRETLERTRKDFSVKPGVSDHFGLIQNDLDMMKATGFIMPENTYVHMNGLSHNFKLMTMGEPPVYKKEMFDDYLRRCLGCQVPLEPGFVTLVKNYLQC